MTEPKIRGWMKDWEVDGNKWYHQTKLPQWFLDECESKKIPVRKHPNYVTETWVVENTAFYLLKPRKGIRE